MKTINSLFASAVERFHDQTALLEPTNDGSIVSFTYDELQAKVYQFAGYLQEQHIGKGDRVMMWAASRVDWMTAFLGTLLVGGVLVPLDINSKQDFLERIAQTTESAYLITTQKQYAALKNPALKLIDLDNLPRGAFDAASLPEITGDDLAELVFTSGTTGQPKGVMLSHWNIASDAMASLQSVDIKKNDRTLSILPLSHMFELTIEVAELEIGASILYARSLVPDTLLKLLGSQGVTCMVLVPQALQLFMNGIERQVRMQKKEKQWELLHRVARWLPFNTRRRLFGAVHKRFGGHFRFFVSGGAFLPPSLAERWENMGFRVMQGYGATECSPVVSVTRPGDHRYESIGHPLPGVEVEIAGDGELLVHGSNVARGYWKNPEATAAAFQNGWYHTGDLGNKDASGRIFLKGRKKNLIVLANGMNVYPEDIENILLMNPAIKDAVIVGLMDKNDGPTVHGILLMDDPTQAKAAIQRTNKQLASHQQVRGYTIWPEKDFPRTHTLKVKRPEVMEKLQAMRNEVKAER